MRPDINEGSQLSRRTVLTGTLAAGGGLLLNRGQALGAAQQPAKAPFPYVQAKAFHIPPQTNTEESGYFSLCEGRNGKIYVGTQDGKVVCIDTGDKKYTGWPCWGANAAHTGVPQK